MDCGLDGLTFDQPSLCKPQFADDCNISNIIRRFMRTGQLPDVSSRPTIESTDGMPVDFAELQQRLVEARQAFDLLPLEERNKYNNNPEAWVDAQLSALQKPVEEPGKEDKPNEPGNEEKPVEEPSA